jgi:hypothetical protein
MVAKPHCAGAGEREGGSHDEQQDRLQWPD